MIVIRDNANGTMVPVAAGDRVELILSSSYWDVAWQLGAARATAGRTGHADAQAE